MPPCWPANQRKGSIGREFFGCDLWHACCCCDRLHRVISSETQRIETQCPPVQSALPAVATAEPHSAVNVSPPTACRTPAPPSTSCRRLDELSGDSTQLARRGHPGTTPARPGPVRRAGNRGGRGRSEEHTSELQSRLHLVCRLLLEKKKKTTH